MHPIIQHCQGKRVHIATHWDCDGVCSGGLLYHFLKPHVASITTISKGDVFSVEPHDIPPGTDITICSDIQPSLALDPQKTIYVDHHPNALLDTYLYAVHDEHVQSCSLLIWRDILMKSTANPYYVFLTLLGYAGDSGVIDSVDLSLYLAGKEQLGILFETRMYGAKKVYELEQYVSLMNTGKRMHWSGRVPLELVKAVTDYKDIVLHRHPLVDELLRYKMELRSLYNQRITVQQAPRLDYALISCDKNIQGVLCSRHMKEKPILVANTYKDQIIASMRVPDSCAFDAGAFLSECKRTLNQSHGGGHAKAGGITFSAQDLPVFLQYITNYVA